MASVTTVNRFDQVNDVAREMGAVPNEVVTERRLTKLEQDLDQFMFQFEQLNLQDVTELPRGVRSDLYIRLRELCEEFDVGFRAVACKRTQVCVDILFEVMERVHEALLEARKAKEILMKGAVDASVDAGSGEQ